MYEHMKAFGLGGWRWCSRRGLALVAATHERMKVLSLGFGLAKPMMGYIMGFWSCRIGFDLHAFIPFA